MILSPIEEFAKKEAEITVGTPLHGLSYSERIDYLRSLGNCERVFVNSPKEIDDLATWSLVGYTPNTKGENGYDKEDSINYTIKDFLDDWLAKKLPPSYDSRIKELENIISLLSKGLKEHVVIIIAEHNKLIEELIVDGVKRSIALYYLRMKDPRVLDNIFSLAQPSEHSIYALKFLSDKCEKVFPWDFLKLAK